MRILLFVLISLSAAGLFAQSDTLRTPVPPDSVISLRQVNRGPRMALLYSIIPGGGQVYNKRWWKVPLVYSGLLGIVAVAEFNTTRYNRFRDALTARCLGDDVVEIPPMVCQPMPVDGISLDTETNALVLARDNADRARQQAYFGILAVYLLQAVEAYTDAHLRDFDISDDISFRLEPTMLPGGGLGVGVTVPLGAGLGLKREVAAFQRLSK